MVEPGAAHHADVMAVITPPQFRARGAATLGGMNTTTSHRPPVLAHRRRTPALRSVEGIHRSTTFHWVGNGFHVSTYFPSAELPPRSA